MTAVECPYHHPRWRNRTQQLLNVLRGHLLSHSAAKQFSTTACVCPEKGRSPRILHTISDLFQWIRSKPCSIPANALSILEGYLNTASQQPGEQGVGLVGVVSIIYETANDKQSEVRCEHREEQWTISISPGHLGLLIGRGGCNIKPLCNEHGVSVYFGDKQQVRRGRHIWWHHYHSSGRSDEIKATLVARKRGVDFRGIKQSLEERVKQLKTTREQQGAFMQQSKRKCLQMAVGVTPSVGVYRNSKEAATNHYQRKQKLKTKTRHPSRSKPHGALLEGHCLNCLSPYCPNHTEDGVCTFHAGFLIAVNAGKKRGYEWTCCGRTTAKQHATVNLHTRTGCSNGRHIWRPGRDSTRKTRDSRHTRYTFYTGG